MNFRRLTRICLKRLIVALAMRHMLRPTTATKMILALGASDV